MGLVWVGIAGIVARVLFVVAGPGAGGLKPLEFSVMADHLNRGHGFIFEQYGAVYQAYKEPLYVILLAWINRITGGGALGILLLQGFFGVSAAIGTAVIARSILGMPGRSTLAGMIVAVNPFLVFYDTRFVHPLSLDACGFLLVAGSVMAAIAGPKTGAGRTIIAGLLGGLVLWERAALIVAGAMAWCAGLGSARAGQRLLVLRRAAIWLGLCLVIISPWLIRNYHVLGRPMITSDFAHVLWLGNNPLSNGTYSDQAGRRVFSLADPAFQARIRGASELQQSDAFFADAARFIAAQPGRFAQLTARRAWAFVWFSPNAGAIYSAEQGTLYRIAYSGLSALGLIGLVLAWKRLPDVARRRILIFGAAVAGVALVHALTAINLKHRVPLELFLSVFAAEALAAGWIAVSAWRLRLGRKAPAC